MSEVRQIASDLIDEGETSPAIIDLFALRDDSAERADAFGRMLRELGAPELSRGDALRVAVEEVARAIVTGAVHPAGGAEQLYDPTPTTPGTRIPLSTSGSGPYGGSRSRTGRKTGLPRCSVTETAASR